MRRIGNPRARPLLCRHPAKIRRSLRVRPEDRLLLICSRRHFDGEHRLAVLNLVQRHRLAWDSVCSTAARHDVAPLVYAHLAACPAPALGIPDTVLTRFRALFARNLVRKERQAHQLAQALALLNARGVSALLVKSAALDLLVYGPRPYTTARDIDLVLSVQRGVLMEADRAAFAAATEPYGIEYDYVEHHDLTIDGVLPMDFRRIWAEARPVDFRGQPVLVMSPEDLLLAACISGCRHHFLRLRNLCDIAEIIRAFPALNWSAVVDRARAQSCHMIVYTALQLTRHTVGCEVPETVLEHLGLPTVRRAWIDLFSGLLLRLSFGVAAAEIRLAGRRLRLSSLLSYSAYNRRQVGRKLAQLAATWSRRVVVT